MGFSNREKDLLSDCLLYCDNLNREGDSEDVFGEDHMPSNHEMAVLREKVQAIECDEAPSSGNPYVGRLCNYRASNGELRVGTLLGVGTQSEMQADGSTISSLVAAVVDYKTGEVYTVEACSLTFKPA